MRASNPIFVTHYEQERSRVSTGDLISCCVGALLRYETPFLAVIPSRAVIASVTRYGARVTREFIGLIGSMVVRIAP